MSSYTVLWIIWLLQFAAIEGAALFQVGDQTLSEHVWAWFSVRNKSTGWLWRRITLFIFLLWLLIHLVFAKRFFWIT